MRIGLGSTFIDFLKILNYNEPTFTMLEPTTTPPSLEYFKNGKYSISSHNGVKFTLVDVRFGLQGIESVNGTLSLYRNGELIKSGIVPLQDDTITVNEAFDVTDARIVTYTLSGVDIKGKTFSKSFEIWFYMPYYFGNSTLSKCGSSLFSQLTAIRDDPYMSARLIDDAPHGNYIWLITPYDLTNRIMLDGVKGGFYEEGTLLYNNYLDNVAYPVLYYCYRSVSAVAKDTYHLYIEYKDGIGNV